MHLNLQKTPITFVILFINSIMDQSEGGLTRKFGTSHSAATHSVQFVPSPMAKTDILCKCLGFFKMELCSSASGKAPKEKEAEDDYVCCRNCTIQMLFQRLCTNGTDPNLSSMKQAETHNGNEYDSHCNGHSFVSGVAIRANDVKHECASQSRKICPNSDESISSANKPSLLRILEQFLLQDLLNKNPFQLKILRLHHRNQVRNQLRKLSAREDQHRPEPPKANYPRRTEPFK